MEIKILEEQIDSIQNENLSAIIELIIDAVRDFPLLEMSDTKLYFDEVKRIISSDIISKSSIEYYLRFHQKEKTENDIWINSSLNLLLEALSLMDLYEISFFSIEKYIN